MRRLVILAVWLAAATFVAAQQSPGEQTANEGRAQEKFVSGGIVRMHLEAGDYAIEGSDSSDIVVDYSAKNSDQLKDIRVSIRTSGSKAELSVKGTPHNDFHATIKVPRVSNLWARLSAGDLRIKGVEGDKDVESHAGDVDIQVGNPEDYGHRDASVTAGDIDASAFNVSTGGLWRSFRQDGSGKYRLHVHLMAGDVTLR